METRMLSSRFEKIDGKEEDRRKKFLENGYDVDVNSEHNKIQKTLYEHITDQYEFGLCKGFHIVPIKREFETLGVCSMCKKILERWRYDGPKRKKTSNVAGRNNLRSSQNRTNKS